MYVHTTIIATKQVCNVKHEIHTWIDLPSVVIELELTLFINSAFGITKINLISFMSGAAASFGLSQLQAALELYEA